MTFQTRYDLNLSPKLPKNSHISHETAMIHKKRAAYFSTLRKWPTLFSMAFMQAIALLDFIFYHVLYAILGQSGVVPSLA
jgi:hypothetical protein